MQKKRLGFYLLAVSLSSCGALTQWKVLKDKNTESEEVGDGDPIGPGVKLPPGLGWDDASQVKPETRFALQSGVSFFSSCQEIDSYLAALRQEQEVLRQKYEKEVKVSLPAGEPASIQAGSISEDKSSVQPEAAPFTNVQEQGVDEEDFVKIGTHHILVAREKEIQVVDRHQLTSIGTLAIETANPTMYVDGDYLVVLEKKYVALGSKSHNEQVVTRFLLKQGEMPEKKSSLSYTGSYVSSRLTGGRLYLVLKDYVDLKNNTAAERFQGVSCTRVARPVISDYDYSLVHVVSIPTQTEEDVQELGVIGSSRLIYMTSSALYLVKYGYDMGYWRMFWDGGSQHNRDKTTISAVALQDLKPLGVGQVDGRVKDQWALREYAKHNALAVATTTNPTAAEKMSNDLTVLKLEGEKLTKVASIDNFGENEDIRAIRYVKNMAYVVTFEKTDPLFAFDMTDPLAPKMVGELKIPGFSTYLHPLADEKLLGVGFDAANQGSFSLVQGVQVSLFDVHDPKNLNRLDVKIHGSRGSFSEVTSDHHAFFYSAAQNLIGIPVVENGSQPFSGAVLYQAKENKLEEVGRLSHKETMPQACQDALKTQNLGWWQMQVRSLDINRLFQVDGQLLSISRFALKSHSLTDYKEQKVTVFPSTGSSCLENIYPQYTL